jgi:peptidoglycan hydrolase-like protein with peptidoglycan-binding domain
MSKRELDSTQERQQALIELGFDMDPYGADGVWGFVSRSALEAFQEDVEIRVDGIWGPQSEKAVRRALARVANTD